MGATITQVAQTYYKDRGRFSVLMIEDTEPSLVFQFGDNIQTKPTALEYHPDEKLSEEDGWYCLMTDSLGNYNGRIEGGDTDLKGWIYVIKDMPEDYVFYCGDQMLTGEEIKEILNKK